MTLREEVKARTIENSHQAHEERTARRAEAVEKARAEFEYGFGEPPEAVEYDVAERRAVCTLDGLRFARHDPSYFGLLETCDDCGREFIVREHVALTRWGYGSASEPTPEERRARVVQELASRTKLVKNHGCREATLRRLGLDIATAAKALRQDSYTTATAAVAAWEARR